MSTAPFKGFLGEIPKITAYELPPNTAQRALNVDLQHGDIRGLRGNTAIGPSFSITGYSSGPARSVYTDDGINFFAWPYDVYPVKSQVVGEIYSRVYYSAMDPKTGPVVKVARTKRVSGAQDGVLTYTQVAGSYLVGGNFQPPENSNPVSGNGLGPDCWLLGVNTPVLKPGSEASGVTFNSVITDQLDAILVDRPAWPNIPKLTLRVTYFIEDPSGAIVWQTSIGSTDTVGGVAIWNLPTYTNVFYTYPDSARGNKIQDMLFALGHQQAPYKYYFYNPPDSTLGALSRTVTQTNTGSGPVVITYGGSTVPDPGPVGDGGSGGGAGGDGGDSGDA